MPFGEELEQALRKGKPDEKVAVFCLDLDRFKAVDDTLGHQIGDALLRQVAERLKDCTAPNHLVARLGGDEFAIIHVGNRMPMDAKELAEQVIANLSRPYDVEGFQVVIGASVGIALAPGDGLGPNELLTHGVRIPMDDFGTGYSSLRRLRKFPFDKIKLDQSFVRGLSESDGSMAIVRAVMDLGIGLGTSTIAEGVETAEELACLAREGCIEAQGYLISRPRPAAAVAEMLAPGKAQLMMTA